MTRMESQIELPTDYQTYELPSTYTRDKTVTIIVGPDKERYFVHRSLLAMKSPFFATSFVKCWDGGNKEEIELEEISSDGFEIILDWIYSGHLLARLKDYSKSDSELWASILHGYKAADMLMISELYNNLIANEAAMLLKHELMWGIQRLQNLHDLDLRHTTYYKFAVKIAVANMMKNSKNFQEDWDKDMASVEGNADLMADLIRAIQEWTKKPWPDFPGGDLSEFFIEWKEPGSHYLPPSVTYQSLTGRYDYSSRKTVDRKRI